MNEGFGVPQKLLARLGALTARCTHHADRDDAARVSLGRLASDCGERHPAVALEAITTLAQDDEPGVRDAASSGLVELLGHLGGLARLGVAIDWATSDDALLRLAAAKALGGATRVMGLVSLLDLLSRDSDPQVRLAACLSCASWIDHYPYSLAELLSLCAEDQNASISAAAFDGLRRAIAGSASRVATDALVELAGSRDRGISDAALLALVESRAT